MGKKTTKTHRTEDARQVSLLDVPAVEVKRPPEPVRFERGNRDTLYFGNKRFDRHLVDAGQGWVVRLADILEEFDWSSFEASYKPGGRPPTHPSRLVGLIVYGSILGQTSLRQLEGLAARDFGALWMTAGLIPDFTTLNRFMQRQQHLLSDEFFVKTAWAITKRLKLKKGEVAIDGTIVQAVSSSAKALKRDSLDEALEKAVVAGDAPRVERLKDASLELAVRQQVRDDAGKPGDVEVLPLEPEAVLLPQKNSKDFDFSYCPVVATHESGLIVGQTVSPSSETECVPQLLSQHQDVFGAMPERVLADSGFNSMVLLALLVEADVDCLIPSGASGKARTRRDGRFSSRDFSVSDDGEVTCPAGTPMRRGSSSKDGGGRQYTSFHGAGCADCPLRDRCTSSARPRLIKLYDGSAVKRAMDLVMEHPAAQRAYRRRAPIVETTFARLRRHGLTRFRRRGLAGVRLEFALAAIGHNFRLLLWGRAGVFVFALAVRRHGGWCCVAGVALRC